MMLLDLVSDRLRVEKGRCYFFGICCVNISRHKPSSPLLLELGSLGHSRVMNSSLRKENPLRKQHGEIVTHGVGTVAHLTGSPPPSALTGPHLGRGLRALTVLAALPSISAGSQGPWQPSRPWGTQVFPFWKASRCPRGSKEVNSQV